MAVRQISTEERRARLAVRHRLAPAHRAASVEEATESLVALHATEAATVYLSLHARVADLRLDDVDRALYRDRSIVKQMAMRRTLFVFPRATLPAAVGSVGARVAAEQRRLITRDIERVGLHRDGAVWLEAATEAVLGALADGRTRTASELRDELAELQGDMSYGEGRSWAGTSPFAPRVLTALSADGLIMRSENRGPWWLSRPAWTSTTHWLGAPIERLDASAAHDELVRRWLGAFGPGTERDLKWWLGSTLGAVRRSLTAVGAVAVDLDGTEGWVLPDDVGPGGPVEPWVALLPVLDPTTMGWQARDWYLGDHRGQIFDTAGNAGATAWCDGRIVGGWHQDDAGNVVVVLLEDVGREARAALDLEAERLSAWLGGTRVGQTWASPLMRAHVQGRAGQSR